MKASTGHRNLVNFVLFQGGWIFVAVRHDNLAAAVALSLVALHLLTISREPLREGVFILIATLLGSAMDSLWLQLGLIRFAMPPGPLIPLWLIALWALFVTTLWHSLYGLVKSRWRWVLPPVAGPFAYFSAARLGALEGPQTLLEWGLLALGWWLLFPLLAKLTAQFRPPHERCIA